MTVPPAPPASKMPLMPREHPIPRAVIAIAVAGAAITAVVLLLLHRPLHDSNQASAAAPGARQAPAQPRRVAGDGAGQEKTGPAMTLPQRQDSSAIEEKHMMASQPKNAPSFSDKPMEPVLPALDEVRRQLAPHIARCVAASRDSEEPPADPFHVRLELFIERGQARVEFERVEPEGDREFPVLDACLATSLADKRFAVRSAPPADYAQAGVFHLPWVAKVSIGRQAGGGT